MVLTWLGARVSDDASKRGKVAEKRIKDWLKARSDSMLAFDFYRYPDARAGSFARVPADFEALQAGQSFLIEVKEVNHAFRLPSKNFAADKVARMVKRRLAGATCWVLIYFVPTRQWRAVELDFFRHRESSWDLREFPEISFEEATQTIFG
jgi:penicillin-binding protein-related factor A (putative recombinase)